MGCVYSTEAKALAKAKVVKKCWLYRDIKTTLS